MSERAGDAHLQRVACALLTLTPHSPHIPSAHNRNPKHQQRTLHTWSGTFLLPAAFTLLSQHAHNPNPKHQELKQSAP